MSEPLETPHDWVRARLLAWGGGVLDPAGAERLEQHLEECEACRALAAEMRDPEALGEERGEHLPAALLARWERRSAELKGLARTLARRHLDRCEVCRVQLETLGYRPELPWLEDLEGPRLPALRADPPASRDEAPRPPLRLDPKPRRRVPRGWFFTSGALVAAAAGLLLFMQLGPRGTGSRPVVPSKLPSPAVPAPGGPSAAHPPRGESSPPRTPEPVPELLALGPEPSGAVEFPVLIRGGTEADTGSAAASVPHVRLTAAAVAFRIPLEIALLEGNPHVVVEVVSDDGRTLRRMETDLRSLVPGDRRTSILLRQGDPALTPGVYELRFLLRADGAREPERHSFRFRIE